MKTLNRKHKLILPAIILLLFTSWRLLRHSADGLPGYFDDDGFTVEQVDKFGNYDPADSLMLADKPLIRNVYIQKIKGDSSRLLVIAKVREGEPVGAFFTIDSDDKPVLFRDDGKAYDLRKGDGFYTAKINVDVNEFLRQATTLSLHPNPPRFSFDGREVAAVNTDKTLFQLDENSFDNNSLVNITNLGITAPPVPIIDHSLFITNLGVVEDSTRTWNPCTQKGNIDGPWTFKTLMKQLATTDPSSPPTDAQLSDFVANWLDIWLSKQIINGDTVAARGRILNKVIQPWLDKSFEAGAPSGQLDMRFAPFKLTAIVNRVDLRAKINGVKTAGQARLVFCLINSGCTNKEEFNVIFEYGVNKTTCKELLAYAQEWYHLKDSVLGSPGYNAALQHITDQFTLFGTNVSKVNQSSLNQIRTNEVAIAPTVDLRWELREFILDSVTHQLKQTTVKKEPQKKYNARVDNPDVERMVSFINNNKAFGGQSFLYPDSLDGYPFIAGSAIIDNPPCGDSIPRIYHWDGADKTLAAAFITNAGKRQSFSQNACSGCHSGETQTGFTQVDPVFFGKEATLSGFLTGVAGRNNAFDFDGDSSNGVLTVKDPAGRPAKSPTLRAFNDLQRRANSLETLANSTCGTVIQLRNELMFQQVTAPD